ncbi:hypothetical protein C8R45DRAFT_944427 [Mycena sanguinolenta]|nr:hypothetical protein C8R45DRAFT_944427 [Mycena sanguinolenta]
MFGLGLARSLLMASASPCCLNRCAEDIPTPTPRHMLQIRHTAEKRTHKYDTPFRKQDTRSVWEWLNLVSRRDASSSSLPPPSPTPAPGSSLFWRNREQPQRKDGEIEPDDIDTIDSKRRIKPTLIQQPSAIPSHPIDCGNGIRSSRKQVAFTVHSGRPRSKIMSAEPSGVPILLESGKRSALDCTLYLKYESSSF